MRMAVNNVFSCYTEASRKTMQVLKAIKLDTHTTAKYLMQRESVFSCMDGDTWMLWSGKKKNLHSYSSVILPVTRHTYVK
jgi:hypothetical protein